jgi:phytoene synthase
LTADDLDGAVRRADPDRWLASRFIGDPKARADVVALYAFDHELDRAGRVTSNPLIAEIRLAWWRETLDEIHQSGPVRAHPVARALADAIRGRSLPRGLLDAMINARIEALAAPPSDLDSANAWADAVGGSAAILAARILDPAGPAEAAAPAGRVWSLVHLRRAGRVSGAAFDTALRVQLGEARRQARCLSARAFPAALAATLARAPDAGPIEGRLRLVWAAARGSI